MALFRGAKFKFLIRTLGRKECRPEGYQFWFIHHSDGLAKDIGSQLHQRRAAGPAPGGIDWGCGTSGAGHGGKIVAGLQRHCFKDCPEAGVNV